MFSRSTFASYAWRIDAWPNVEDLGPLEPEGTVITGPSNAPVDLLDRLAKQEGNRFRLVDDDGLVYCKGRIVFRSGEPADDEDEFAPLTDYGAPGMGCTTIDYWVKDPVTGTYSWQTL